MSQGSTLDELMDNMKEAIELAIECRNEDLKELYKGRKVFHRKVKVYAWKRKSSLSIFASTTAIQLDGRKVVMPNSEILTQAKPPLSHAQRHWRSARQKNMQTIGDPDSQQQLNIVIIAIHLIVER